jgi:tetratricopeptide (TPR) repeat protein
VAAGRDEEAAEGYREALELNPGTVGALGPLAAYHASRGELDQALVLCEKTYALAPLFPHVIGLLAGLLKRTGETRRAEELLGKLQPSDAFGAPRGLAVYHWVLREFDAEADWLEKAIEQRDLYGAAYLRYWYGRELRSTPRWAGLMRNSICRNRDASRTAPAPWFRRLFPGGSDSPGSGRMVGIPSPTGTR